MHALCLLVLPPGRNSREHIAIALEPFNESTSDQGWWDWYQIGGRFTGIFDDYSPRQDPRNFETCRICKGTGVHPKSQQTCAQCEGSGIGHKWPTDWVSHPGDITTPEQVLACQEQKGPLGFVMVTGEVVIHREQWNGEKWTTDESFDSKVTELLRCAPEGSLVVAIDYHS